MNYDHRDPASILEYAKRLLHKTLRDFEISVITLKPGDKGGFGKQLETDYFGINPGNAAGVPDFPEAGVEVKSTKLLVNGKDGLLEAGERLKLSSLNYDEMEKEGEWDDGHVYKKNKKLLLVGRVFEREVLYINQIIELVTFWEFPEEDLVVIRNDWNRIVELIQKKLPLSESHSDYLAATTAGPGGETDPIRKTRALSLKRGYMTAVIRRTLYGTKYSPESILKRSAPGKGESLEDRVVKLFAPHIGKSAEDLVKEFGFTPSQGKNYHADVANKAARAMLGVSPDKKVPIAEFEKAEILMKTVRLEMNGVPKQHMMLRPAFKYTEIVKEFWESSELRNKMLSRFLFVVFQEDAGGVMRLEGVHFWTMPEAVLEKDMRWCWDETVKRINEAKFEALPKSKESVVCHVRPMALNKNDTFVAQDGNNYTKKGFWLRNTYVASIIKELRAKKN